MAAYARRMFAGGAIQTTVPLSIGSSDSSFTLATGGSTNWPDGSTGNFVVVVDVGTPEKILCSSRTGLVVTVAASGRGYDGTSAVSHPAGSAIQVVHCAQDDDEANQVVSAVLGQSGAAKGDILYMLSAAGPNTLKNLAIGSNGTQWLGAAAGVPAWGIAPMTTAGDLIVAASSSAAGRLAVGTTLMTLGTAAGTTPTWAVLPGTLLASTLYAPGTLQTVNLTGSLAVTDSTHHTVAFTVPASGNVDVEVEALIDCALSTQGVLVTLGLLNHSGGAQVGNSHLVIDDGNVSLTNWILVKTTFHLTGLSAGALQLDLAGAIAAGSGGTISLRVQGATGALGGSNGSELLMRVLAA